MKAKQSAFQDCQIINPIMVQFPIDVMFLDPCEDSWADCGSTLQAKDPRIDTRAWSIFLLWQHEYSISTSRVELYSCITIIKPLQLMLYTTDTNRCNSYLYPTNTGTNTNRNNWTKYCNSDTITMLIVINININKLSQIGYPGYSIIQ